ncbi:MAG: hypothetical protein QXU40_00755, partial [Candidatus Pacearchaeota archaeon]
TSIPPTQVDENRSYYYEIRAYDPDGDILNYRILEGPNWLNVSNNIVFGTSPEVSQNTNYHIKIRVSDLREGIGYVGGFADQAWDLTVKNVSNLIILPEPQTNQILEIDDNKIVFSQPTNFSIGDIIVSSISAKTPEGFLREVQGISQDRRTINTRNATLEEAIKNGDFSYSGRILPPPRSYTKYLEGIKPLEIKGANDFDFNISLDDVVLFDLDRNPNTTYDRLIANGYISFSTNNSLNFSIREHRITSISINNSTDIETDISLSANIMPSNLVDNYIKLVEYRFAPFIAGYIPAGPVQLPVIITPILEVSAFINQGEISDVLVDVNERANSVIGLTYEGGEFRPSSRFSSEFDFSTPILSRNLDVKVLTGPRLNFFLYGILGPFGAVQTSLNLKKHNSLWELYGGYSAYLGFNMEIFKRGAPPKLVDIINREWPLASGSIGGGEGGGGKILFISIEGNRYQRMYYINPDGTGLTRIPNISVDDLYASWFPDNRRIALCSIKDGNYEIYTMNIDGLDLRRLTYNSDLRYNDDLRPNVSPDGQEILFISNRSSSQYNNNRIFLMNFDGTNQRELILGNRFNPYDYASWSYDGQKIVYSTQALGDEDYSIYIANKDGSNRRGVVSYAALNNYAAFNPHISPDGSKIVFEAPNIEEYSPLNQEIYIINVDGTGLRNLTNDPAIDANPWWSPDGSQIVFVSTRGPRGNANLYIMNSDGTNPRILYEREDASNLFPVWSWR